MLGVGWQCTGCVHIGMHAVCTEHVLGTCAVLVSVPCPVVCLSSAVPQWYLYLQYYSTGYRYYWVQHTHWVGCVHCYSG